jgi:hypothetical protein
MTFGSSLAAAASISRLISMANVGTATDIKVKRESNTRIILGLLDKGMLQLYTRRGFMQEQLIAVS